MESANPPSSTFALRNLIALIAIIGLGLVVSVPLVRKQRELARQIQCINNLKQIGLAVRNFHDVRKEIIPSYLTDDHSSAAVPRNYPAWPVLIFPFLESENRFFPLMDLGTPLNAEPCNGPQKLDHLIR